jgi:Trk K+ transport system NAD-binding subunit
VSARLTVILGGDQLAFRVCEELRAAGEDVVVIWRPEPDVATIVASYGARFVAFHGDPRAVLDEARIADASVSIALTEDDQVNLQFSLEVRDHNPTIRIVLRQFNRTLGRKLEDALPDCAVISLSALSAAVYAATALDPACFFGVEFPYVDGRLMGFARRTARDAAVDGSTAIDAELRLGARIVSRNGTTEFDRAATLAPNDALVIFSAATWHGTAQRRNIGQRISAALRRFRAGARKRVRPNPVILGALATGIFTFALGTLFFAFALKRDVLTAAYFVLSTMTTTGYGDITPPVGNVPAELGAMILMLGGLAFSGIFIAILTSRLTAAQYVVTQGLRRISQRGHVVVCGAGNVGSRVIDYLVQNGANVVVVEMVPQPELVDRARSREFALLTGDASKDRTLDLCNVAEAGCVVAITNSDAMNLEVALGVRQRNAGANVVMRVQYQRFEASVRKQFGFEHVFGTAAIAAPVFAGLAYNAGMRGRLELDAGAFAIVQRRIPEERPPPSDDGSVVLAVWRAGRAVMLDDVANARAGEDVLALMPIPSAH